MATDVSAPLPQLDFAPGTTITVTLDDASAKITKLNVFGYSPAKQDEAPVALLPPVLAHESAA